jgi:hypothetical protein
MVNGVIRVTLEVLPWIRQRFIIAGTLAAAVPPLFPRLSSSPACREGPLYVATQ